MDRQIIMDKRTLGAGLGALLCVTAVALAWTHRPTGPPMGLAVSLNHNLTLHFRAGGTYSQFIHQAKEVSRLDAAATAAMNAGRYAQAEHYARRSIAAGQDSGIAQELLAASLNAQGKTREAMAAYQAISDVGGTFPRNELPYALLLLRAGRWRRAVAEYDKAFPPRPDLGLKSTHNDFSGLSLMNTHNRFSPDTPQPGEMEADIDIGQGQYRQALALAPDSEVARYYYAYGLWDVGQRGEAREAFRQVAQESHDDIRVAAQEWLRPELVMTGRDSQGRLHQMVVMDTMSTPRTHPLPAVPTLAAALRAVKASGTTTTSRSQ